MDPWNDKLDMLKSKPVGQMAERERMPFEVTPFILYLTREVNANSNAPAGAVSADSKEATAADANANKAPQQ
jgi:hypothetical protein